MKKSYYKKITTYKADYWDTHMDGMSSICVVTRKQKKRNQRKSRTLLKKELICNRTC